MSSPSLPQADYYNDPTHPSPGTIAFALIASALLAFPIITFVGRDSLYLLALLIAFLGLLITFGIMHYRRTSTGLSARKKFLDFFVGFSGAIVFMTLTLFFIPGLLLPAAIGVIVVMIYARRVGRQYISIGIQSIAAVILLAFGACLGSLVGIGWR
jgi:hypothetical protein